jgi:transcriptional regulator with XRE-family HTH domain
MKINKSKIGFVIKKIRSDLKITQKELAKRTRLTINYLSLLENGKRGIGFDKLNKLAEVFGVPAQLLVVLAADVSGKTDKNADRLLRQIQKLSRQAISLHISFHRSL